MVDFWSRAGTNQLLRGDGLRNIMGLFDEANWKKARDLQRLLAAISYEPESPEEDEALAATNADEGENDE